MSLFRSRVGVGLALGGLAVAAAAGLVPGASAATTTTYSSSCFAQLLKLSLGGTNIPLDGGRSCDNPGSSFFPTDTIAGPAAFPFVVNVLYESTSRSTDQSQAKARAGVAHVFLPLSVPTDGGLPDVTVDVLTSEATCSNGAADSSSHVVGLNVGGKAVELPDDITGSPIDLAPLAVIEFNKTVSSSSTSDTGVGSNPRVQRTTNDVTQTALHVVVLPTGDPAPPVDVIDLTIASTSASCTKTVTTDNPPPPPSDDKDGWMNGGGTMVDSAGTTVDPGTQVSHGFVLPCHATQSPPPGGTNLVVNGDFGRFKLVAVTDAHCTLDPNQGDPENPKAGFNTMNGSGTGTCNGEAATVSYHFTDEGEPNTADEATLHIRGGCTADVVGILTNGNNQAHPLAAHAGNVKGNSAKKAKKH